VNWIDRVLQRIFKFFVIENAEADPYLVRYKVFRCPWFKVFLHHILRSDEDPELHCHPWNFMSFILRSGYYEILPSGGKNVPPGRIIYHRATDAHRLLLERPAWTLVFAWGKKRVWGFHTKDGWLPYSEFFDKKYGKGNWASF
jgi:hypothetical protein